MSNRDLSLALRLYADSARFVAGLTQAGSGVQRFGAGARREMDALKSAMGSVRGQLAQLGLTVGVVATAAQSARMDKGLTQIGQTAAGSKADVENLRRELFRMAGDTGQQVDDLQQGFNNAVQSGLNFKEALPVIDATNKAMAVTGANADRLTAGLTVAGQAFQFDLAKPGMALTLLDKMTVAGRLGNAELENLSDIFGRVGVNAASAGMGFDQTLGFIESLSRVERNPERLATLADSTLRLFTNLNYMREAAKATGVKFFDAKGERRDAVAILGDIKTQYDKLQTDKERALYLQTAFGKADLDTIKGLRTLLSGDSLAKVGEFSTQIGKASGAIERDLPNAIANAVDQTGRLKNVLREAADEFAKPINDSVQSAIRWGLDKKENGGLGLDGKDIALGGTELAVGTFLAARYGGKFIGGLAKRFGGTAAGVAEGKALEAAAGVTPVYVVNWPASMGGTADILGEKPPGGVLDKAIKGGRWGAGLGAAGFAALPGLALWGATEWAGNPNDTLGSSESDKSRTDALIGTSHFLSKILGFFGFDKEAEFEAIRKRNQGEIEEPVARALNQQSTDTQIKGEIRVRVDQDGRVSSVSTKSDNRNVTINPDAGHYMMMN